MKIRAIFSSILVGMLLLSTIAFGSMGASAAWSGDVLSFSPGSLYIGYSAQYQVTFQNTCDHVVTIQTKSISMDWTTGSMEYELFGDVEIYPDETVTWHTSTFTVPSTTPGQYDVNIHVDAIAAGDWWGTPGNWVGHVNVYTPSPLSVVATSSVTSGTEPVECHFSSSVSGAVAPYYFSWSFGDGSTSTSSSPYHTYSSDGIYTVQLKVTDGLGRIATDTVTITVNQASATDLLTGEGGDDQTILTLGLVAVIIAAIIIVAAVFIARSKKG